MDELDFSYQHTSGVALYEIQKLLKGLEPEIERMREAQYQDYISPYSFVHLPYDQTMLDRVHTVVAEKKQLQPDIVILVGIGGSNLGTLAVHEFLSGILYNIRNLCPQFYCVDTIEYFYTHDMLNVIEHAMRDQKKVLVIVVSKSGTTLETTINAALIYNLVMRYSFDTLRELLVIISDKGSPLHSIAQNNGFSFLEVPHLVGGRYSIFSPVSLFPLALLGIDIDSLCKGARAALASISNTGMNNWAAISAVILYAQMLKGCTIHDTFIFSPRGSSLGLWYRQLMAESLGKRTTYGGEPVSLGITPTVSIGSTDLHSMAQLYFAGLRDKITTIIGLSSTQDITIPTNVFSQQTVAEGQSINTVYLAITKAVETTYHKEHRPFMHWQLPDNNPYALGELVYYKMAEIVYLGYLMKVNPFDQPEVELYKSEMRRIFG